MNDINPNVRKRWLLYVLLSAGLIAQAQTPARDTFFNEADAAMQQGNYAGALLVLQKITDADPANVRALQTKATAYGSLKNYADASRCYEQLSKLQPNNAGYCMGAGWYLMLSGQYLQSEKFCLAAMELNDCSFANYLNLGHVYGFLKQKDKCLEYYKKAASYIPNKEAYENAILPDFELLEAEGNFPYKTAPYKNMFINYFSNAFLNKKYGTEILDSIYQLTSFDNYATDSKMIFALKERFIKEEQKNETMRLYVLRDFYVSLGWYNYNLYSKSISLNEYFKNAIKVSNSLNDTVYNVRLLYQMGRENKNEGGDYLVRLALDMTLQHNYINLLYPVTIEMGDRMRAKNKRDSAMYYYRQSFLSADASGIPGAKTIAINRLTVMFGNEKNIDSIHFYYTLAKSLRTAKDADINIAFIDDLNYCTQINQCGNINASIKKAKEFIEMYGGEKKVNIADLYEEVGTGYYELNNKKDAAFYFREAIRLNRVYMDNNPGNTNAFPLSERYTSFEKLKRMALAKKDIKELFDLSEQCKANILYPVLTGKRYAATSISTAEVAKQLTKDEAVISYSSSGKPNIGYSIGISHDAELLVPEDYQLLDKLVKKHKDVNWDSALFVARKEIKKSNMQGNQEELDATAVQMSIIANYLNMLMAGVNTRGITPLRPNPPYRNTKTDMPAYNDILYSQFIKPFEKILQGKTTVYISTDLGTALIPFEALKNEEGKYLGELYHFIYIPSLTSQAIIKKQTQTGNKKMLALGNPEYSLFEPQKTRGRAYDITQNGLAKWSDLPGTGKELLSIQRDVPGVSVIDKNNLSEGKIKALSNSGELAKYDILHFAVHGMASLDDYRDNALILSEPGGSTQDGFLQFDEITRLKLKANLVCLSACETAAGLPAETEEVKNLPVAFLLAGAGAVIATWWKIDDDATGVFMSSFYGFVYKENKSYPEALYLTRKKFIQGDFGEIYKSPYYWAAFKYFGN